MTEITENVLNARVAENIPPENILELPKTVPLDAANDAAGSAGGFLQKIRGIADNAFAKTVEVVKNGRGRPRKDGKPKISDAVREVPGGSPIPGIPLDSDPLGVDSRNPAGDSIFDGDLIKTCVSAVVKGVCQFFKSRLADMAIKKGASEGQAERLASKCDVTGEEIDSLGKFAGILLKKYNVDTQYAPEFAFGAILTGIGLRFAAVASDVKRLPAPQNP